MYQHPTTRRNRQALRTYGNHVLDAPEGELASGLSGAGRMMEPDDLVRVVEQLFHTADSLAGKRVLITAGPTHEPIDPVRFLSNASSGKMGYALAEEAARRGAEVHLISGPTALETNHPNIHLVRVQTAQEMLEVAQSVFPTANLAIFAAAVADYTPQQTASQKIKKSSDTLALALTKTVDIAQSLSAQKQAGQRTVGFALETENELKHAAAKLQKKHLDMIVLNSLNDAGAGFGHDTNQIKILTQNTPEVLAFPLKDKRAVAADIFDTIISTYYA